MTLQLARVVTLAILLALFPPSGRSQSSTAAQTISPSSCLESQARPPVTNTDLEIVDHAAQILNSPVSWNRADNRNCPASAKTFSLYCALEKATTDIGGTFQHREAAMQEARFVIDEIAPRAKTYDHRLMDYNNDPGTSFADIRQLFRLLQSRIAERLKEDPTHVQSEAARLAGYCANLEVRILRRVREILDSPSKWDRAATQRCSPDARTFGLYCAFARATQEVLGDFDGGGAAIDETRNLISQKARNREKYQARLIDYNNDPTVTFQDLQNLLATVEERLVKHEADIRPR